MSLPSPDSDALQHPSASWWAGGLARAERLPATGPLAARTPRPAWATVAEAAIAAAPANGLRAVGDDDAAALSLNAFAVPLRPFVEMSKNRVGQGAGAGAAVVDLPAICAGFADQLARRLVRLAARTLVLELNVARVSGRLSDPTPRERFAEFTHQLASPAGLAALFEEYPVLARLLGQACEHAVDAHLELMHRFAADRTAVIDTLLGGTDPGALVGIEVGGGDLHQRGRSVAMLRFADGETVVYKPRCQQLQAHFGRLVHWLNGKVAWLELRAPAALPRAGYGWVEFVAHRPCAEIAEVDRFYRRQGALLALLYAVDGTDIHYENLIAAGDQPVLVDVETLFHPTFPPAMTAGPDPAHLALTSSVSRTALLPLLLLGEHGALDISGLGGDKGATFPFDAVSWDASGTDEMRLVRRAVEFPGAINRPRLGDRDVDPGDYRASLLTGFQAGYDAIVAHRHDLVGPDGLLGAGADNETRIVVRSTRLYATLRDESTHPDVLRDGLDRDSLFDVLWADSTHDPFLRRLVPHEIADLWAGDVPMFTGRPGSGDVWTARGERIPDLLDSSSLTVVTSKIMAMNEVDRRDQEWLITASLATRAQQVDHRSGATPPGRIAAAVPDPQRLLAAACAIADEIVARSVHDDNRANWLGVELLDGRHWAVLPLGAGLADGYTGVALFLAQLGALTGTARYVDLARKALHPVPRLIDALAAEPEVARSVGPGGFLGLGGICYALARLSRLLGDDDVRGWLPAAVDLAGGTDNGQAGIATGRAGGLLAMLAVHAETGLAEADRLAAVFADRLVADEVPDATGEPFPRNGFAGGPAGVGYALLRFAATGAGDRYLQVGRAALERDRHLDETNHGWCTGMSGALLSRADLPPSAAVDRYVTTLADREPLRDTSLCHGELGVTEALTVLASRGHDHAAAAHAHSAARVLGALDRFGPRCGTPDGVPSPGLLTGLAGIGYGLLRLGFAEHVPSVLLLEPSGTDSESRKQTGRKL